MSLGMQVKCIKLPILPPWGWRGPGMDVGPELG